MGDLFKGNEIVVLVIVVGVLLISAIGSSIKDWFEKNGYGKEK